MRTQIRAKRWLVRNVRRLVGTEQILQSLNQERVLTSRQRLAPAAPADSQVLTEVNGDPVIFPKDLLPFIEHTLVSPPNAELRQFLVETPHYYWIRQRLHVGATVLDVGSNIGLFAIMMARQIQYGVTGWVYAFEPSPIVRRDLQRMLACNGIENVAVFGQAVSDRCGEAVFLDVRTENVTRESSHLAEVGAEDGNSAFPEDRVAVETIDLDTFIDRYSLCPQLFKIDVEGAEFLVLEGARKSIAKHKPLLVIEIHPDKTGVFDHARLRRFLDEYEYRYHHQGKIYYCE